MKKISIICIVISFLSMEGFAYKLPKTVGGKTIYGIFDVTDYGADITDNPNNDDTQSIQDAIEAAKAKRKIINGKVPNHNGATEKHVFIIYFPAGTYNISNTLYIDEGTVESEQQSYRIQLMGENKENTIIKLKNNCVGFTNPNSPKPMWRTINVPKSNTSQNYSIEDLTFNIGRGNKGAIGVDHFNNNLGSVRNVKILCHDLDNKGVIGFKFDRQTGGIVYIKDLFVKGFETGIKSASASIDMVLENIDVRHCNIGFHNHEKGAQVRNFVSYNVITPIRQTGSTASLILIDSRFFNGQIQKSAIERIAGQLYLRNAKSFDFKDVYGSGDTFVDEFVYGERYSLWGTEAMGSLKLPVFETPNPPREPLGNWVVIDCDAQDNDDAVIQSAINSGAKTIFLTGKDHYKLSKPINLKKNVERFHGGWGKLWLDGERTDSRAAIFVQEGTSEVVIIEGFSNIHGIRHNSSKVLVIQSSWISHPTAPFKTIASNPGNLFIDEVCPRTTSGNFPEYEGGPAMLFKNQTVMIRDLNIEGFSNPLKVNNSRVWMFGFKFGENISNPAVNAFNGSSVEVLGGLLNGSTANSRTLFINNDSEMSIVGVFSKNGYSAETEGVFVREIHPGLQTRELMTSDLTKRTNNAFHCPLFVSRSPLLDKSQKMSGNSSNPNINVRINELSEHSINNLFEIVLFPNPSFGNFSIKFSEITVGTLIVFDVNGKKVYNKSFSGEFLNITDAHLFEGVYMINIITKNAVFKKQLIVTK